MSRCAAGFRGGGGLRARHGIGALLLLWLGVAGVGASEERTRWRGRALEEVLTELQDRGLRFVFSSAVVPPSLRVEREPRVADDRELLRQLLAEHGLVAAESASGWLVVRRADARPRPPSPPRSTAPLVLHDKITVRPHPWLVVTVLHGGEPLIDLKPENFVVRVDGKRRAIVDLRLVHAGEALPTAVATRSSMAQARSLFLLLIDTSGEQPSSIELAREAATALAARLAVDDLLAVAVHTGRELVFPGGQTGSPKEVGRTLDALQGLARPRSRARPSEIVSEAIGLQADETPREETLESGFANELRRSEHLTAGRQAVDLLSAVAAVASHETGLPGRKQIILLSPGFDRAVLEGVDGSMPGRREHFDEMNRAGERGQLWLLDNDLRFGNQQARNGLLDVARALRRTGGRLFTVYTGPEEGSGRQGLDRLAVATEGVAFSGVGAFRASLPSLVEETSTIYFLGLEPGGRDGSPGQSVEVRLRRAPRRSQLVYNRTLLAEAPRRR